MTRSCALVFALLLASRTSEAQSLHYRVVDSISAGSRRGDFYTLDSRGRRLYGAGGSVVDVDTKQVIGEIADTAAGGGFVVAPELARGVVRNGTLFDLTTLAVIGRVPARGDASVFDPVTRRAFLLGDTVAVIDVKSGALIGMLPVIGAGESGVADGRGRIYINLVRADSIAIIDARSVSLVGEFSTASCRAPMGLAIDQAHRRLFAACDGNLGVFNGDDGALVALVPTGGHSDENAFDPASQLVFMPNGRSRDGQNRGVTIVHEDSPDGYTVVQTLIDSAVVSNRIVIDERTHRGYLPHYDQAKGRFVYVVIAPTR